MIFKLESLIASLTFFLVLCQTRNDNIVSQTSHPRFAQYRKSPEFSNFYSTRCQGNPLARYSCISIYRSLLCV